MAHCLIFEAASIHEYLMASGRLRHIVGASERIEALCGLTLDKTLAELDLKESLVFSRRAGGVFVAHAEEPEPLQRLAQAWSLLVREQLPGMAFKLALGEGKSWKDSAKDARRLTEGTRPASARILPFATPFSRRHRATGAAAVAMLAGEPLDAATLAKARAADHDHKHAGLGGRFLYGSGKLDWPMDLSAEEGGIQAFPFLDAEQSLALVVADGNGLGQLLKVVHGEADKNEGAAYAEALRKFSKVLEEATQAAARNAVENVVSPKRIKGSPMPMRPILLGGDDVAVIIRADLALGFAQAFAEAFEKETATRLKPDDSSSVGLTASIGIVYFGRRQPIAQVQSITYELLKVVAKKQVKLALPDRQPAPAAIAWHRLTVSEITDLKSLQSHDWICRTPWGTVQVAGHPYVIGDESSGIGSLGSLQSLLALRERAKTPAAVNHLREILGLLASDAAGAVFRYWRWHEVDADAVDQIQALSKKVFGDKLDAHPDLPFLFKCREGEWVTPIGDLLALMAAEATA